jgi:hypothetical protein
MKKFYFKLENNIILDVIEYPHEGYIEVDLNETHLPAGINVGYYRLFKNIYFIDEQLKFEIIKKYNSIQVCIKNEDGTINKEYFSSIDNAKQWISNSFSQLEGQDITYQDIQICLKKQIVTPVKELVFNAKYDEYGNEITPAVYAIVQKVIEPAIYEDKIVVNTTENKEIIIEKIP